MHMADEFRLDEAADSSLVSGDPEHAQRTAISIPRLGRPARASHWSWIGEETQSAFSIRRHGKLWWIRMRVLKKRYGRLYIKN